MASGVILAESPIDTPTPVTVYSYPVEKSVDVIVSVIDVVLFVVLLVVPVVKAGVIGCDLAGMAYKNSSSINFFIHYFVVTSVTNCPVVIEPAPPGSKSVIV